MSFWTLSFEGKMFESFENMLLFISNVYKNDG